MQNFFKVGVLLLILTFSLAGCSDLEREHELKFQINVLRQKNLEIQKKYDDLKTESDGIKTKVNDAALAQGCDWLISLCPNSLVAVGRQAISEGYRPNPILFWLYALFKFIFLAIVTGTFWGLISYIHFNFNMPNKLRIKKAEEILNNAMSGVWHEKTILQADINKLNIRLQELLDLTSELDLAVQKKGMHLNQLDVEIRDLTVVRDALQGI